MLPSPLGIGPAEEVYNTGSPKPRSSKEALLALAGKYKDDPDLEAILQEAMRRRGRPRAEEE